MKYSYLYKYKNYTFTLITDENSLLELRLKAEKCSETGNEINPVMKKVIQQLDEYFSGRRKVFELLLSPQGTEFQTKVWKNLSSIPYGKTITYKQLAELSGNPRASRAVGMANNKNPIAIIIPCHRVIGSNGNLTGYAGGLDLKRELIELEKSNI